MINKRVAVVTGAARGIGKAIAEALGRSGAAVVVNYRSSAREAEELVAELEDVTDAIAIQADVSVYAEAQMLIDKTLAHFGHVDMLVNNAGIVRPAKLLDMTPQDWHDVLTINLTSCFNCSKAALGPMVANQFGRIINISSAYGQTGAYGQTNYCAAKAGMIGFTKALALETAKSNITVNAIAPGLVETEMASAVPEKIAARIIERTPIGRLAKPAEIASLAAYLVSDAASYITGQVIGVNGGLYM